MKYLLYCIACISCLLPQIAFAHVPQYVETNAIAIEDTYAQQVFYGILDNEPHVYTFESKRPFDLSVSLFIPDMVEARTDISAFIQVTSTKVMFSRQLQGNTHTWTPYRESFTNDMYLYGPTFKEFMPIGTYTITVSAPDNLGPYVLVIGGKDPFFLNDSWETFTTLPKIKKHFFHTSTLSAYTNIFGIIAIVLIVFSCGVLWTGWFIYRKIKT